MDGVRKSALTAGSDAIVPALEDGAAGLEVVISFDEGKSFGMHALNVLLQAGDIQEMLGALVADVLVAIVLGR